LGAVGFAGEAEAAAVEDDEVGKVDPLFLREDLDKVLLDFDRVLLLG
jgi:hypothetical protein